MSHVGGAPLRRPAPASVEGRWCGVRRPIGMYVPQSRGRTYVSVFCDKAPHREGDHYSRMYKVGWAAERSTERPIDRVPERRRTSW
jgi:hypothetical protein